MNGLIGDIRFAFRMLRKSPGFTALAIFTLALGIGANTAIFSNVNALILHPFALPDLDRVVAIWETVPQQNAYQVKAAPANFQDWSDQSRSFEHLAAVHGWGANLTGQGVAERAEGYQVTPDFFPLLGVEPHLGRNIGAVDFQHGTAPVVVVSYGFWQTHLAHDANIIGKTLQLNGQKFTVVGVAGRDVDFPAGASIWAPIDLRASVLDRDNHYLVTLGRLKKESTVDRASADLQAIASRLAGQFPNTNGGHQVRVVRLAEDATQGTRQFVLVLMGAAGFVLLLACVNVANLQIARASSRQKELAVRLGMGASRWQLIRQLLVESVLLSMAGGVAGLVLGHWGLKFLRRDIPPFILLHVPGLKNVPLDSTVFWFTFGSALIAGILAGLAPALRFSRSEVSDSLKENTRASSASVGSGRLRTVLVTSEIALALVLLVGAGVMVKGFRKLIAVEMGFDRTHVLTFHVALPGENYRTKDQILSYYDRAMRQIQSLPGVTAVACVTSLPSGWSWTWTQYSAEGRPPAAPGERPGTISQIVTPDLFTTLRVPLRSGRLLSTQDDRNTPPVAVISESMARAAWPGQDPLGKHVRLGSGNAEPERKIVGIVGDVQTNIFGIGTDPTTYIPLAQMAPTSSSFVVRTVADPMQLAGPAISQIKNIDPDVPAYDVRTLEGVISDDASGVESAAQIMLIFAVVSLMLAAAGIFAVMAYSVGQRTHEIGVRMALGARRFDVLRLVVSSAFKMAVVGLSVGLALSLLLTRALSSALLGIIQVDVAIFAGLTLLLALVASVAAYVPARWATKVDPMQALRCE